jgi:LptA/(LptD N-terminal domain) LPS transport protein
MRSLFLLALMMASPASAQALKGHNASAPVDVDADRIEVQDRADRAIFSGNVKVRQGGLSLDAARLTVAYSRAGGGPTIQRLDASGGVSVRSASESATGSFAIYDLNRRLITMIFGAFGDRWLCRGRRSRRVGWRWRARFGPLHGAPARQLNRSPALAMHKACQLPTS